MKSKVLLIFIAFSSLIVEAQKSKISYNKLSIDEQNEIMAATNIVVDKLVESIEKISVRGQYNASDRRAAKIDSIRKIEVKNNILKCFADPNVNEVEITGVSNSSQYNRRTARVYFNNLMKLTYENVRINIQRYQIYNFSDFIKVDENTYTTSTIFCLDFTATNSKIDNISRPITNKTYKRVNLTIKRASINFNNADGEHVQKRIWVAKIGDIIIEEIK